LEVRIVVDENIKNTQIVIRCTKIDDKIVELKQKIESFNDYLTLQKDGSEYKINLHEIIFIESQGNNIYVHTKNDCYRYKSRMYELENILPKNFIRISQSAIVNADAVSSITKSITSSSLIEFKRTHKKIYASRRYIKEAEKKIFERKSMN